MYFVDETIISLKAGKGGDGIISFRREKNIPKGGPDGGNGGNGGNILIRANKNINTLSDYQFKKKFFSENGENGKKKNKSGKNGNHCILQVPLGTKIFNIDNQKTLIGELKKDKETIVIAKGGKKGLGNHVFKSSINRTPKKKILGKLGESKNIKLELSLLADVGTLGLPNSGKSTLIRKISSSKTKIGNYPFTTLYPHLAAVVNKNKKKIIIADLPGIIKGASIGIGLGIQFLKHLTRCKILLHIIDFSFKNKKVLKNIKIVLQEIKKFKKKFKNKEMWLIFNKIDLIHKKKIFFKKKKNILKKFSKIKKIFFISAKKKINLSYLCKKIFKNF